MKKIVKILPVLILIITSGCAVQKGESNIKEVVFNAHTRGRSETITLVNNNVYYKTHQDSKTHFIDKAQREELETIVSKIDLKLIADLKAPSGKRLYDGAMHGTVTLKIADKTYVSSSFDDDNPPAELKDLVTLLRSFVK